MISHKHRCIFVHIPKTGGTSIEKIFPDSRRSVMHHKHRTLQELEDLNKLGKDYFKFSFVRNPWDLTVSMYHMMWVRQTPYPVKWRGENKELAKLSFNEWIRHSSFQGPTIRSMTIGKANARDGHFSDWTEAKNHKLDFVGKFENLQNDFDKVCDYLEIRNKKLPHENKTQHSHYTEYYDDETQDIVARKYADEIQLYNYNFGD